MVFPRSDRQIFRRLKSSGLAALLTLLIAGCASAPREVAPTARIAPDRRIEILAATTRRPSGDPGALYSGERGDAISFDRVAVEVPASPRPPHNVKLIESAKLQSERDIRAWVLRHSAPKRRVLIYVHGFNTSHAEAVFRLAQLVHEGNIEAAPVLFSWPSRGGVFDYLYDKESANYSRRALETLILQASDRPDVGDVTIIAHSMGGWLTAEALRAVALKKNGVPGNIRNVVLASPDLDVDVFRRQWLEMGPRRPHFTLITSTHDKALDLSRWLSGGIDRVGGVDLTPYRPMLASLNISIVDTSAVDTMDPLGHNDFADSPEIVRLLGRQVAAERSARESSKLSSPLLTSAARAVSWAQSARLTPETPDNVIASEKALSPEAIQRAEKGKLDKGEIAY
jgi:esterase/lipase superfamily enzyme